MNIHSLNDYNQNDNNAGRSNNNNNQNNQFFIAQMGNPENSEGNSFFEQLFPKTIFKLKTASFINNMYYNWYLFYTINCLLFNI